MSTPFGHGGDKGPPQKTEKTRDFEKKISNRNMVAIALTPWLLGFSVPRP